MEKEFPPSSLLYLFLLLAKMDCVAQCIYEL